MNRIFLLLIIVFGKAAAQIPNNDFELWTDYGSYDEPDGWHSNNSDYVGAGLELLRQTSDAESGDYAMRMENKKDDNDFVMRAMVQSGSTANPYFHVTGKPDALQGWLMYDPNGSDDSCYVLVQMTRFNSVLQQREVIGEGFFSSGKEMNNYEIFSVPIIYFNSQDPDSAMITIYSGKFVNAQEGSRLYLDDLDFVELVSGVTSDISVAELRIFPNPASSFLKVEVPEEYFSTRIELFDLIGNLKKSILLDDVTRIIDIRDLPEGRYFYKIGNKKITTPITGSFVISR